MYNSNGTFKKIKQTGLRQGWWHADSILVALSGGGDSVALLMLLHKFFVGHLYAAHLDHNTRNGESHEDAIYAEKLCRKLNIPFFKKVLDVAENCRKGESFEMAARRIRYDFFYETMEREHISFLALGHTSNDRIETQLMNLFRGTGLKGLRGIPETRGDIIRPVINFSRDELRDFLRTLNVSWCDDYTNDEALYTRNKIRLELIPWIKENLNSNVESVLLGLAGQIDSELDDKKFRAEMGLNSVVTEIVPALCAWNVSTLGDYSDLDLAEMLRLQGEKLRLPVLNRRRTELLVSLIRKGESFRFQWAKDIEVCYSRRGMGWLHRCDIRVPGKSKKNGRNDKVPWWVKYN